MLLSLLAQLRALKILQSLQQVANKLLRYGQKLKLQMVIWLTCKFPPVHLKLKK